MDLPRELKVRSVENSLMCERLDVGVDNTVLAMMCSMLLVCSRDLADEIELLVLVE